jgi:iron complex transport system substrate-binding protein
MRKNLIKRNKSNFLFAFLVIALIFSCKNGANNTGNNYYLKIKDSYEREIVLKKKPTRVISLAPNVTEIIFALDAGKLLVGRTEYCDYPEDAKKIPSVGGLNNPSIESILKLKPDIVIASTHFQKNDLETLEKLNIPVYIGVLRNDYTEVYSLIENIGTILDRKKEAAAVLKNMKGKISDVEKITKTFPKKNKIYYMISFGEEGDYTAGKDSYISFLIKKAGGINIADDVIGWQYTLEALFKNDPDIIICSKYNDVKRRLGEHPVYKKLRAVKNGNVYEIDNNMIDRMSPRNADGLTLLSKIINPEAYK